MIFQTEITLLSTGRGYHIITSSILKALPDLPSLGLLHVFIKHTSAALSINENADYTVRKDFETIMNKIVPEDKNYLHADEGPDDMPSHVKSSLMGASVTIPISDYTLNLGTWQGIYLCEFRTEPQQRKLILTVYS